MTHEELLGRISVDLNIIADSKERLMKLYPNLSI
jgi:hypothetical protein